MAKKEFNAEKVFYIIIAILILAIITFGIGISYLFIKSNTTEKALDNPNIYNNIYIQSVNVSNLSKEEAILNLKQSQNLDEKFILQYNDKIFQYTKNDLGIEYDFEKSVDEAYNIARIGDKKDRRTEINLLKKRPINIPLYHKLDEQKLDLIINQLEKELNKQPTNSKVIKKGDKFELIEGTPGLILNSKNLKNDVKSSLNENGDIYLTLELNEINNKNNEDLKMIKHKLGGFITKYSNNNSSDSGRITNMKIAAESINGIILYPGEIFSTNEKFGETNKANGYKPAKTIINGKFKDEYGGGVCQVSSTLYNALLYSELDIIERRNHSLKVGYLDYSYDATLAGNYIDLKFKNSSNYPIYIESYLTNNEVICNIYGYDERPKNRTIKFENVLVEKIQPGPKIINKTNQLPAGVEKVSVKPLTGYKYKLYKLIYLDGKLTDKVLVNTSYYKPRAEEVLLGIDDSVKAVTNSKDKPINNQTETTTNSEIGLEMDIINDSNNEISDIVTDIEASTDIIENGITSETTSESTEDILEVES